MKNKRKIFVLLALLPFIIGTIGYSECEARITDALYAALSLYFTNKASDGYNIMVEFARWTAPLVTGTAILSVIKNMWQAMKHRLDLIGGKKTAAVYTDANIKFYEGIGTKVIYPGDSFKNYTQYHIIMFSSDKKTFEFYKEHKFTLRNKKVYIGIRDIEGSLLKTIPDAVVFDINNMIARGFWKKLGMWKEGKEKLDIVIYGSSNLAGGIISTGLQMNIFSLNQHINYHFITDNKLYRIRHKNLQLMNSDKLEYYSTDDENIWEIIENADKVIVADEVEVELLQTIILSANNSKVYYYSPEDGDMGSYIEYRKPVPFGRHKDVFTEENILREKLTEKAKALHNYYESICNTDKKWEDLSGFLRASNISAADFGNILADLNKDEMELAELEHIRWCRFHFLNYYKYGEVRNDAKRIHNDLVRFDELSLEEQEKDLDAVRVLKKLVKEN